MQMILKLGIFVHGLIVLSAREQCRRDNLMVISDIIGIGKLCKYLLVAASRSNEQIAPIYPH